MRRSLGMAVSALLLAGASGCISWSDAPDGLAEWEPSPVSGEPVLLGIAEVDYGDSAVSRASGPSQVDAAWRDALEELARELFPDLEVLPLGEAERPLDEWEGDARYRIRMHQEVDDSSFGWFMLAAYTAACVPTFPAVEVHTVLEIEDTVQRRVAQVEAHVTRRALVWLPLLLPLGPFPGYARAESARLAFSRLAELELWRGDGLALRCAKCGGGCERGPGCPCCAPAPDAQEEER